MAGTTLVIPPDVAERAASRWEPDGDCWVSAYSVASHGYAQVGWFRRGERGGTTAHRGAWAFWHGQPGGMTVDHMCKNRRCVRPQHLRLLSNFENARRTRGRDWPLGECINGHPNSLLVRAADGGRECSECKRANWR